MINKWIRKRFGDYVRVKNGQELRVNCPFCLARTGRSDTNQHLYVSMMKPVAHCFRCEWSGHYLSLIMSVEGCSYKDAVNLIKEPPPDISQYDRLFSKRGLVRGDAHASVPEGFVPVSSITPIDAPFELKAVRNYLRNRKVPDKLLDMFGWIRGTNRVWMMIDNSWWQGRSLAHDGKPKYISPPWPIGDSLWNSAALCSCDKIVVCEGVFSAIAEGPHAIAVCGKTIKEEQANRMAKAYAKEIMIKFDADATSNSYDAAEILEKAGYGGKIIVCKMLSGDPADGVVGSSVTYRWDTLVLHRLSEF